MLQAIKLCGENYAVKAAWCKICGASCVMQSMWYKLCGASFAAAHWTPTRRPRAGTRRNLGTPAQRGAGGAHEALTSGRGRAPGKASARPPNARSTHETPTGGHQPGTRGKPGTPIQLQKSTRKIPWCKHCLGNVVQHQRGTQSDARQICKISHIPPLLTSSPEQLDAIN